ncbi:MAG: sulfatase [Verrucomicrobiota bacterium]|nr:sulfatase [Verrucomicrobiota bacterium]
MLLIIRSITFFVLIKCAFAVQSPNLILINVDDLGWKDLGCYGSDVYETPNIDKLARNGLKFTNAYSACAVCSPTRAAIMTGRYPARLGVTDWIRARFQGGKIPKDKKNPSGWVGSKNKKVLCPQNALWMELEEVTIAEKLKEDGYATCHIGKWHLGADDWYPEKQGFDENYGGCDYGQPPSYFDPFKNKRLDGIYGLPGKKQGQYLTDRECDEAVMFIKKNRQKKFFLNFANYAVHTPIQAKPSLLDKYKTKIQSLDTKQKNAAYATMVESVDQAVGRIITILKEEGIFDRTLIIFTSDNGGLLGVTNNAPLRSGKGFPYEGGIRVPLIIFWPDFINGGKVIDTPVSSIDFFPTLCSAAGINNSTDKVVDGLNLLPLIKGENNIKRQSLFWHFPHYRGKINPYSIIRNGDWKLIKRYDGKPFELFNLKNDLSEKNDLSQDMPEKVKELNEEIMIWLLKTNAKVPRANPDYANK